MPLLDSVFGNAGIARIGLPSAVNETPTATSAQADGKLLVGGQSIGRTSRNFVVRFNRDGSLDSAFGNGGAACFVVPGQMYLYQVDQVEQRPDGLILIGMRPINLNSDIISDFRFSRGFMMASVHLRERRQITLPIDVVSAAGLTTNDSLEVSYVNGIIQLVPHKSQHRRADMSRFLGAAGASFGADTEAMNQVVRDLRESW